MPKIEIAFFKSSGIRIELIYGSSMAIARQIQQGAPYDVFLSADRRSVNRLRQQSLLLEDSLVYGRGKLAVYVLRRTGITPDPELRFLTTPRVHGIQRVAIANPQTAPYGSIAETALRSANALRSLADRLVLGQNALQTAQFAASGSVEVALIPVSIARHPKFLARGESVAVSRELYRPLTHEAVLTLGASKNAKLFFEFLHSDIAKAVFQSSGF